MKKKKPIKKKSTERKRKNNGQTFLKPERREREGKVGQSREGSPKEIAEPKPSYKTSRTGVGEGKKVRSYWRVGGGQEK